MNFNLRYSFALCCALLFCIHLKAQFNPEIQEFVLLPGENFEISFYSSTSSVEKPVLVSLTGSDILDENGIEAPVSVDQNTYKLSFSVDENYLGKSELILKYFSGDGSWAQPSYMALTFEVVETIIQTKHDYQSVLKNGDPITIDLVSNDFTTHGPLKLVSLVLLENGSASIVDDQSIEFSVKPDFQGMSYANYVVENTKGITATGSVSICVLSPDAIAEYDEIELSTSNKEALAILLPGNGFTIDGSSVFQKGEAQFIGSDVIEYTPDAASAGSESFLVVDSDKGISRLIIVHIIDNGENRGSVRDDKVYSEIDEPLVFNVFDNDLTKNEAIIAYSPELEYQGNGQFYYLPPLGFSGIKQFFYTIDNGYEFQEAKIYVFIDNYYPELLSKYNFVTKKNTPYIINYQVPIDAFNFRKKTSASNGKVLTIPGISGYKYDCGADNGRNLVVYKPDKDFVGIDEFILEYCIKNDQCKEFSIVINVEEDDDCGCAGSNCIWPGDSNNDGKVFISDLLPIGYHMGAMGNPRSSDNPDTWIAQFGNNWNQQQFNGGRDLKYIDANGDGIISTEDTTSISSHYSSYHNLVSSERLIVKDFPFYLIPRSRNIRSGDWLELEVAIGNESYPVSDVHGIAYSIRLPSSFVDSSSVVVEHINDWFGYNSPILNMAKQPIDGKIDIASTRTTGVPIFGDGRIQKIGIIVEEDLDGFKPEGNEIPFEVEILDIKYIDGNGNTFALPDQKLQLRLLLNAADTESESIENLIVFPNPANEQVVFHLNGSTFIQSIELFNLSGKRVLQEKSINLPHHILKTQDLIDGLYVARVITSGGSISQKIQINHLK